MQNEGLNITLIMATFISVFPMMAYLIGSENKIKKIVSVVIFFTLLISTFLTLSHNYRATLEAENSKSKVLYKYNVYYLENVGDKIDVNLLIKTDRGYKMGYESNGMLQWLQITDGDNDRSGLVDVAFDKEGNTRFVRADNIKNDEGKYRPYYVLYLGKDVKISNSEHRSNTKPFPIEQEMVIKGEN